MQLAHVAQARTPDATSAGRTTGTGVLQIRSTTGLSSVTVLEATKLAQVLGIRRALSPLSAGGFLACGLNSLRHPWTGPASSTLQRSLLYRVLHGTRIKRYPMDKCTRNLLYVPNFLLAKLQVCSSAQLFSPSHRSERTHYTGTNRSLHFGDIGPDHATSITSRVFFRHAVS